MPFRSLVAQRADSLLRLIGAFRADPRAHKIDLGVGVFRDDHGHTPVMQAVKQAEMRLIATQDSKAYLGPEGDKGFVALLEPLVFGREFPAERRCGLQTPGGTGALRLGGRLPTNTSGGQLSEDHCEGMLQIVEGVRQLRHLYPKERQVKDAEIALISGHGGNQVCHSTLILGRA